MNLVFHGAEHSRFAHSVGASCVAAAMFDAITRNSPETPPLDEREREREDTILATLLHDVGHGPFSHTLEEITDALGVAFHHEEMTTRILTEPGSAVAKLLAEYDPELPGRLVPFIDKKKRDKAKPRWNHAIVSSQLDADRLDYLQRDAYMAGIRTHTFDLKRLIGALGVRDNEMVVDARARDVVDSYLLALDHMYASAYYHHTNRSASFLITSILRRAVDFAQERANALPQLFPPLVDGVNPLWELLRQGKELSLQTYQQLDDALVWFHITLWRAVEDPTLSGLVDDLHHRRLPKSIAAPPQKISRIRLQQLEAHVRDAFKREHPTLDPAYFIKLDVPTRRTYTASNWNEGYADSIKLATVDGRVTALEEDPLSLVKLLDARKLYPSIIVPSSMRDYVVSMMKEPS